MRYKCQAFSLLLGALALALPAAAWAQGDPRALPPDLASRLDPLLQRLQAPVTPWGPLADARRLADLLEDLPPQDARARLLDLASKLDAQPSEPRALAAAYLRREAARCDLHLGQTEQAQQRLASLGLITRWKILGPFENANNAGFDMAYPAEGPLDPQAPVQGKVGPVAWRPLGLQHHAYLQLASSLNPDQGVIAYVATVLDAPKARRAVLRLGVDGAYKVWLNGELVARADTDLGADLDADAYGVRLLKGPNLLMIKVAGSTRDELGLLVRLTDEQGAPLALPASDALPAGVLAARPALAPTALPVASPVVASAQALPPDAPPQARLDAALLAHELHPQDPATPWRDLADLALQANPTDPDALLQSADLQPQHWRRLERLRAAFAARPDDPEVVLALADALSDSYGVSHDADALDLCARAAKLWDKPDAPAVRPRLLRASLLSAQGDTMGALVTLEPLADRYPEDARVLRRLRDLYERVGDEPKRVGLERRLVALRQRSSAEVRAVAQRLLQAGEPQAALEVLEPLLGSTPSSFGAWTLKARALHQLGRSDEALATLDLLLQLSPGLVSALDEKARLLELMGRPEDAAVALELALVTEPNNRALLERLRALRPDDASFEAAWRFGGERMIPRDDALARHAGQDFYYLGRQAVMHVAPSGRSSRFYQDVIHVLTDDGARAWGARRLYYTPDSERVEVVSIKVRKPDGTLNEAWQRSDHDASSGEGNLYYQRRFAWVQVPTLEPGDVIEYAWRLHEQGEDNFREGYFGDLWHFDASVDTEQARYVLLTPADMPIHVRDPKVPNLKVEAQDLTFQNKPHKARAFEAQDLARVREDQSMPGRAEVFEYVLVSTYETWDQVGRWWWNLIKDQLVVDAELQDLVTSLTKGLTSDRDKVRAIHEWVVKNTRYVGIEFGVHGWKPYRTTLCLRRKFGDCKDKASLIKVMLNAAGIDARMVLIRTQSLGGVADKPANLAIFNHAIAYVPALDLFLDGTAEFSGMGELPWGDQGQLALIVADGGAVELRQTPVDAPSTNVLVRLLEIDLSASPTRVKGELRATGADAVYLRRRFDSVEERRQSLEQYLTRLYPGARLKESEFVEVQKIGDPVLVRFTFEEGSFTKQSGAQRFVFPAGREVRLLDSFAPQGSRYQELLVGIPHRLQQELRYTLPAGHTAQLPTSVERSGPFGAYRLAVRLEGQQVVCEVQYELAAHRVTVADYPAFRAWLAELDRALSQPLPLVPNPQ
jgi:tetratricopeptide (TPR) repeat protein